MLGLAWLLCGILYIAFAAADNFCIRNNYRYTHSYDICYRYDETLYLNYFDALKNCTDEGENLASIHDSWGNVVVRSFGADQTLLGLRYNQDVGRYLWSDGTDVNFTNYADDFNVKNGYCIKMVNGRWTNAQCETEKLRFVCEHQAIADTSSTQCPDKSISYSTPTTLYSPGYPSNYHLLAINGLNECEYHISAFPYKRIKITFHEIKLEEGSIHVCGQSLALLKIEVNNDFEGKSVIVESSGYMILKMVGTVKGRWRILWKPINGDETLTMKNRCPDQNLVFYPPGIIYSPGYPGRYDIPGGFGCGYMIAANPERGIQVRFEAVETEGWCCIDEFQSWERYATKEVNYYFDTLPATNGQVWNFTSNRIALQTHDLPKGLYRISFAEINKQTPGALS